MRQILPLRPSLGWTILLALFAATFARAQAPVDVRPAIEIGSYRVSHYLVVKYYGRYANGVMQREHRTPTPAETQAWLDHYVAQQAIVANQQTQGAFTDPEVRRAVTTMEEHMLTQSEGPFYAQLLAHTPPPSDAALRSRYTAGSRPTDCIVVAFPDAAARERFLGTDFAQAERAEQLRRVRAMQAQPEVHFFEGSVMWPFEPFPEIGDRLIAARLNEWEQIDDPEFGAYLILKSQAGAPVRSNYERDQAAFARHAMLVDRLTFVRRRHAALLRSAHFHLDNGAAARLATVLAAAGIRNELAPTTTLSDEPLYRFEIDGVQIAVTSRALGEHLNGEFMRHLPRSAAEVRSAAEDDAVHQLDLRAARALGIDRAPQFVEDREGYTDLQVLNAYELHQLAPAIAIAPADLQAYYDAHKADYVQTLRIRGRLVSFPDQPAAIAWMQSSPSPNAPAPDGTTTLIVERGHIPPGFEPFEQPMFEAPPGFVAGPVERDGQTYCFQKMETLDRGVAPLDLVRETVRNAVLRAALDRRETELGAELLRAHPAKVTIDPSELMARTTLPQQLPTPRNATSP